LGNYEDELSQVFPLSRLLCFTKDKNSKIYQIGGFLVMISQKYVYITEYMGFLKKTPQKN